MVRLTDADRRYLTSLYDDSTPLPPGARRELSVRNTRLRELREAYAGLALPVSVGSRWSEDEVSSFLDLRYFRGETLYMWHYRELPRVTALKYFLWLRHLEDSGGGHLLSSLGEDGAFGCWTHAYPGYGPISRDLLESVGELCFLERELALSRRESVSVLDIGAGYGRLAHRMTTALTNVGDFCCVDAVPESTFLSEYYLHHRQCDRARVVRLDRINSELNRGSFDLALNIHSFSECTHEAVAWWMSLLAALEVPYLLLVPNEPKQLLTLEVDESRRPFDHVLAENGYRLVKCEPVIRDAAARELLGLEDHFHLFARSE